jgi:hypothetical protein
VGVSMAAAVSLSVGVSLILRVGVAVHLDAPRVESCI